MACIDSWLFRNYINPMKNIMAADKRYLSPSPPPPSPCRTKHKDEGCCLIF